MRPETICYNLPYALKAEYENSVHYNNYNQAWTVQEFSQQSVTR